PFYWHSKAKLLGDLQPGDHLWMVTSGDNLGHEPKQAGFLVAVWTVEEVFPNIGDDPAYPRDDYRYRVTADPNSSIAFEEPIWIDRVVRPKRSDPGVPIGRFLQGPRKLSRQKFRQLLQAAEDPLPPAFLATYRDIMMSQTPLFDFLSP